jgi:hypothetical protein
MHRLILVLALAWSLLAPLAAADVFIAELSFPAEIAEWFEQETARVEKVCPDRACWARELQPETWVLNSVHSAADSNAPRVGDVVAVAAHRDGWPHVRFDYRPLRGPQVVWLDADEIGDWGYGIYVVVRGEGEPAQGDHPVWIQLGGVPGQGWIELKPWRPNGERLLTGELEPLTESVLKVDGGIAAMNRRTGRRMLLSTQHNYVVERMSGAELFLRQEVGADMPCGGEKEEKDVVTAATPRYRVGVARLFRSDGTPLLSKAYPRGC